MPSANQNEMKIDMEPLSLSDLWNVIYRHRKMIAALTISLMVVGLLYAKIAPKVYKAEAVILIESQEKNVEIKSVLAEIANNDQTLIPTEIQVLMSRNLMGKVVDQLQLSKDDPKSSPQEIVLHREAVIDANLRSLEVKQIDRSRTISVVYRGKDPQLAADIVNTLTKLYIDQQISNSFEAVRLTNSWLAERVTDVQNKLHESERKIADYRARTGLVQSEEGGLSEIDIVGLSKKLNDAKARLATAEAIMSEFQDVKNLDTAPSVLSSSLIQRLRESEAEAKSDLAAMSKSYGPAHPEYKAASAKLYSVQSKIKQEINKIGEAAKREYETAKENVAVTEKQIENSRLAYNADKSQNVDLAALEREADINRKFLETLNLRWKETQVQEDARLQMPYGRIISTAAVPTSHETPKTKLILMACLIAGLGLGAGIALVMDQVQNTAYNGKQLQGITGFTNISMIADARTNKNDPMPNFAELPISRPSSEYMEGIRELSAFMKTQKTSDVASKVFCFSSSTKSEGKSSLVASLARQLAIEGVHVLAVDCDIRGQTLSRTFGVSDKAGVTEVLSGQAALREVVTHDIHTGLSMLAIGKGKGDVNLFLRSSEAWQKLVYEAAQGYDIVLLDNSPSLATPEARIISGIGQNIFCIKWKKTPLKVIEFALDSLKRSDAKVAGTVLTMAANKQDNTVNPIRLSA